VGYRTARESRARGSRVGGRGGQVSVTLTPGGNGVFARWRNIDIIAKFASASDR
jgi:hypothetical protein